MENFDGTLREIITQLENIEYIGDVSDIGNEIGIVIARHFNENNTIEDFIHGVRHGVSLTNGTHP